MVRKLYLCPSTTPESVITRCVKVPASQDWLAVFNRALLMLTDPAQWEQLQETDITPEEAAAKAYEVYTEWLSGECSMDCNDVLACVQTVIEDMVSQGDFNYNHVEIDDSTVIEQRFDTDARNTAILPPPDGCNKDELWAGIREIVARIDGNGLDFWETVVAQTDTIDRIAEVIALVPLFGDLVGEALYLLADISDTMRDQYLAFSSEELLDAIACDLFQLVCAECRYPTYQEVFDYLAGRSVLGATHWEELALEAMVDALLGTELASAGIIYYTTNILQAWVLSASADWLNTHGVKFVALWAGIGAADPSDAWELLCGACTGEESPCDGTMDQLSVRFGTTYEVAEGNECLLHCTSGPAQGDGDYYVAFYTTTPGNGQNFSIDTSNPSGLSLVNCRWAIDGGAGHFTNLAGLEAVAAMDDFYIRSNTAFTIDILFTTET
jgi:hypothetical protein